MMLDLICYVDELNLGGKIILLSEINFIQIIFMKPHFFSLGCTMVDFSRSYGVKMLEFIHIMLVRILWKEI